MPDESSESIGGISIGIGASHAQLPGDLGAADRIFEQFRAKWTEAMVVPVRAQAVQTQAPVAPRPVAAQPAAISVGPGASTRAQAQQAQTALQRAINAELSKTGEIFNSQTGEIESATKAYQQQRQAVAQVREEAAQPGTISIDTKPLQEDLQAVLATMREIAAQAKAIASTPVSGPSGAAQAGSRGRQAKNIRRNITPRDIGTAADANRVYTFDPEVYAEQERVTEARSARQRELALNANVARREREARAVRTRPTTPQLDQDAIIAYNNRNAGARAAYAGIGASDINSPNYRSNEQIERSRQSASNVTPQQRAATVAAAVRTEAQAAARARREAFDQSQSQATAQAFAQSRRVRQFQVDEEQQARVVTSRRAAITGSGRTSRTLASGLGALFGGTEQRQFEAQAAASQATRQLASAERAIEPLDSRLRELARGWSTATGESRRFNAEQFRSIRRSDEYRGALVRVRDAVKADASAQKELNDISSAPSVARNLLAITAAGAAFSIGLKVIDTGIQAAGRALDPYLQQATGFIGITNDLTNSLSDQARAQEGNVKGVVAAKLAQSGLAATTAATIGPVIDQRVGIEAGNKAITDQIALIRSAQQLSSQGATAGLGTTTGGLLGTSLFGIPSTGEQIGGFLSQLGAGINGPTTVGQAQNITLPATVAGGGTGLTYPVKGGATQAQVEATTAAQAKFAEGLKYVNAQLVKGGDSSAQFARSTDAFDTRIEQTAKAFDAVSPQMAQAIRDNHLYADSIKTTEDALSSLKAINFAGTLPDLALVGEQALQAEQFRQRAAAASARAIQSQQQYELPSQIGLARRQTAWAIGTQQPAQAALAALANPNVAVGTGIATEDQKALNGQLKEAQGLQDKLNSYYRQGQNVIEQTYRPAIVQKFGQAAAQVFDASLAAVESTGKQIAQIQAGISNEQAAYQVAQYNFQLQIAKRNLSDIGGLTGKNFGAGESYLGTLERQNLALSRQGQLLQFNLSQRQINFQTALAGFQAPGVTPEERQARIAEAKTEASYAQKQLDIQRQMFGNQVQIVDISNLRQGADLARQIALLTQGRRVTLDTAAAEQKLMRLQQLQQEQVARVSTYLTAVDNLAAAAFGRIQQLEAAFGHFLTGVTTTMLGQVGIYINGLTDILSQGGGTAGTGGGGRKNLLLASGGVLNTNGPTRIGDNAIAGEAGSESLIVLSHPRATSGLGGGMGMTVNVTFTGDITTSNTADLDKITQAVTRALGREASLKGLRGL